MSLCPMHLGSIRAPVFRETILEVRVNLSSKCSDNFLAYQSGQRGGI